MKNLKNPYQRNLFEDFDIDDNEATQEETTHAITTIHKPLPNGNSEKTQIRDAADNRDSQPVGTGMAASGDGADRVGTVSGSAGESGATGTRSIDTTGQHSPGETRDSAGSGSEPSATDSDFVIDADELGKGGLGQKYKANIAAIRIIKAMEAEGRAASFDERKQIAKYVGWGAIKGVFDPQNKQWIKQHAELKELLTDAEFKAARKSVLDAHYTGPIVVNAMYDAMQQLGFTGGRVLESSVGVGNFFGMMPSAMRNASQLHGVELDSLTSRLVAALYPEAKIAQATGFEDFQIPAEYFDAVIGNVPFGNQPLVDAERSSYSGFSIHNYFLAKSIDKLRPGGIMQVVVSHNFLDANDDRARKWIWDRAALIGAVRLPNTAFKENAGTEIVTDVLIFQKRDSNGLPNDNSPWRDVVEQVNVNPKTGENVTHKVNQFFTDNPQFVLGTPSAGGFMYTANEYTVEASGDIKEQLTGWVKSLPTDVYDYIDRKADSAVVDMDMPDNVKVGSFYIDGDGKVMQRGDDVMGNKTANEWLPPNDKAIGRIKGMIALRESLRKQMQLERLVHTSDVEIEGNRTNLNTLYDGFLKQHGHINNQTNRRIFLEDTEAQLLQALEFDYDKGISKTTADKEDIDPREPSAVKADIFKRRVAFPPQDFMTVSTAKDALLASLNYRGKVDLNYMAEVYNKSLLETDEIIKELGDVVFNDPQVGVVTADEYLSGDVKTKLTLAIAAFRDDVKFKRNVEALEKVIPKDKKPSEISVSIGAAFIPADIYQQFIKHISGGDATASYMKSTGQWIVNFTGQADPALNAGKFGTADLSAQALFQLSILGRGAVVKKTYRDGDGSTRTVVLEKETVAAREKQSTIKDEWKRWLWSDAERADNVAALFNDKMNRIVDRKFDGGHLTFPGMNPAITLLEHQKNGVWRGLQSYQVLYDHVVGAGKTFEMATLAMEMRRLGISRKPLFVVPNHLTLQWRSEFTRLYPGANILAATPEDFGKDNRERLFSKIITGDWDAVIIGHSSLKKIGLPAETEKAVLQEQLDEIGDAIEEMKRDRGDRNIIRDMEGIRSRLETKMKDKLAAIGKRSKVVTFDELGIDCMVVDEMHEFKNLTYNSTMDRNPGMGNPNGSAKAFDMFVKTRWLFDTFGDKTPFITATGTPVSNSLVEMYNMQRYMQYPTLKQEGLHVFDAWAKQFGSVENVYEVAPSGSGYRQSTRFAKFTNLPALMGLYNTFADTVTLDDLKAQEEAQGKRFPVPKMVNGKPILVVAQRSPLVAALMGIPKAETDESGNIKFLADLSNDITITKAVDSDRYLLKIGDGFSGQFETEQEARLKLVEMAVSPKVSVDPDSILGRFVRIGELTRATKGKVNALSLTGEANKAGLDYRLIDPAAPDFAGSKINLAVDNMLEVYHQWAEDKGTQLIFCDQSIPLSARNSYSSKDRRLYVRDDAGAIVMKRGTLHTLGGHEDMPYFIVQRGDKETKRFDVYDAASGVLIVKDTRTKQDAKDDANNLLADDEQRQGWIEKREAAGEIEQDQIDEYNNEHDVETEGFEFFTREDIAGISGSAKFSVYDDIKAKLIAKGIPEREIAFIHDYSTPAAKDKLFKAINAGEIRFTLGSTSKMGAGTNVQKLLVGLHHIDAPWRPSDLEQREGRIIRRGNELYARDPENFAVFIGRYATEQTYDTRRWQILEHKARGIEQLRNFDGTINEIDDIEGEASNSADMKAAASGDPLILEETKMRNSVRRLEQLQAGHADEVLSMTRKAREAQEYADGYGPRYLAGLSALLDTVNKNPVDKGGFSPVTVNGQRFVERDKAQEAIAGAVEKLRATEAGSTKLIYRGLEFIFERGTGYIAVESPTGDRDSWRDSEPFSPSGYIQRMANCAGRLPGAIDTTTTRIEKAAKDAVAMREQAGQPFLQAEELDATREKYKVIQRVLLVKGPTVPENQKKAVADGIAEQKAMLEQLGYGEALKEFFNDGSNQHLGEIETLYEHAEPQVETAISDSKSTNQLVTLSNQETVNMKNNHAKPSFSEMVAEKLIKQLEEGTAPWQRPWNPGESGAFLPYNPVTGNRYKGINSIYLLSQNHDDQRWMTYKQATEAGAQVRKGEKGTGVQYWKFTEEHIKKDADGKPVRDGEGNPVKEVVQLERPRGFFAVVFNGEQIDGLPPLQKKEHTWNPIERAEGILTASGADIHHNGGSRAFYRPLTDSIHLPDKGQFPTAENYYGTALHELGHWSGHKDRLHRDLIHPYGSEGYAKEELRAEIASMILGDELGIGHDPSQHAAYVGSWIKALKNDPMEIFRAAADAEKIQNYVLGFEQKQVQEQTAGLVDKPRYEIRNVGFENDSVISGPIVKTPIAIGLYENMADGTQQHIEDYHLAATDEVDICVNRLNNGEIDLSEAKNILVRYEFTEATMDAVKTTQEGVDLHRDVEARKSIEQTNDGLMPVPTNALDKETARDVVRDDIAAFSTIENKTERRLAAVAMGHSANGQNAYQAELQLQNPDIAKEAATEYLEDLRSWQQENGVGPAITPEMKASFEAIPADLSQLSSATADDYRKAAEAARFEEEAVKNNPNSTAEDVTGAREQRKTADLAAAINDNDFQKKVTEFEQQQQKTTSSQGGDAVKAQSQDNGDKAYINVPFREKDEAKGLGAIWDRGQRSWYIPSGVNPSLFSKWTQASELTATVPAKAVVDGVKEDRQYLAVSYTERIEAKAAGAIWDKEAKSWYAGPKADMDKLQRWLPENIKNQQGPAMTPREEFADALRALGCVVTGDHPIMDGTRHRLETVGDKAREKAGFYVAHLDGHPAGFMVNNRTGESLKWKSKGYALNEEEKAKLRADSAGKLQEREVAQTAQQNAVAASVRGLLAVAPPAPGDHKYLQTKQARPGDLRVVPEDGSALPADSSVMIGKSWKESKALREANPDKLVFTAGDLLLTAQDVTGEIRSVQSIQENGMKRFATGGAKQDMFHVVGGQGLDALANAPAIVIGEGYATADTLSKALGYATVAAFDSGNLPHVAKQLRGQFPDKPFVIAGDNDCHLELTEGKNPGKEKALASAKAVDGTAIFPIFAPGEQTYPSDIEMVTPIKARAGELAVLQKEAIARMKSFTDFNDLATRSLLGLEGVDRQVPYIVNKLVADRQEQFEAKQQQVRGDKLERQQQQEQEQSPRRAAKIG
jgi:N12 class adenine-specific DNA methylase/antirestriction protein ArdC/phage/plasmid primase-like uncharacterized protein